MFHQFESSFLVLLLTSKLKTTMYVHYFVWISKYSVYTVIEKCIVQ